MKKYSLVALLLALCLCAGLLSGCGSQAAASAAAPEAAASGEAASEAAGETAEAPADAAAEEEPLYGDPWQMIHVFDNDPDTEVVCEGYSKAFQFLCDMTTFNRRKIESHLVTGLLGGSGATGAGAHMWNVVHMDDRNNYLVDVTNCDDGYDGDAGSENLLLKGTSLNEYYETGPQEACLHSAGRPGNNRVRRLLDTGIQHGADPGY